MYEEAPVQDGDLYDAKSAAAAAAAAAGAGAPAEEGDKSKHKRYGPVPPITAHHEEIVDLRAIEYPVKMLATCSRDGAVKIWV